MFAICIEASFEKGMGHLFRMLNFIDILKKNNEPFLFIINDDKKAKDILIQKKINFEVGVFGENSLFWEKRLINKYKIKYWINDRLETDTIHSRNIKLANTKLITFDDLGSGSILSDLNICGLFFNKGKIRGKKVLSGIEYLVLNSEIALFKNKRNSLNHILVTLGGSDTYGVSIKILKLLKKYKIKATIHLGPSFRYFDKLEAELTSDYKIISYVPSLIEELSKYDLAITGGGITPFEANALGLPCLIVANEEFEIDNAKFLEEVGSSLFIGFHKNIKEEYIQKIQNLDIPCMSKVGLEKFNFNASEKIYKEILSL